jgi:hypothetical protein
MILHAYKEISKKKLDEKKYQIKRTESPATSLLALTNTLQPVVRRCRLGCPARSAKNRTGQFCLEFPCKKQSTTLAQYHSAINSASQFVLLSAVKFSVFLIVKLTLIVWLCECAYPSMSHQDNSKEIKLKYSI